VLAVDEENTYNTAQAGFSSSVSHSAATFPAGEGRVSFSHQKRKIFRKLITNGTSSWPLLTKDLFIL
jgi:hypothetical protein